MLMTPSYHAGFSATRAGLGDALVAGNAARGMALLGAAQAMSRARGAANLPLAPRLAGRAMTVVRIDLAGLGLYAVVAFALAVLARGLFGRLRRGFADVL